MSLPLCPVSSKMSIMPSGATQRSDTKVLLRLKRNTPGRLPFERPHACPSQRVHSTRRPIVAFPRYLRSRMRLFADLDPPQPFALRADEILGNERQTVSGQA